MNFPFSFSSSSLLLLLLLPPPPPPPPPQTPPSLLTDPDECVDPTLNDCHENAVCQNVALSFACSCREGFADKGHPGGPGRNCVKNDDEAVEMSLKYDKLKAQVASNDKYQDNEIDQLQSASKDLTGMSIAAIVIAGVMFLSMCVMCAYLYVVRKNSRYLVGPFGSQA